QAVQSSGGKPVKLTVKNIAGQTRTVMAKVSFERFFGPTQMNIAGMEPRPVIESIMENSPVSGKLKPGDVVEAITINGEMQRNPTVNSFTTQIRAAAKESRKVDFLVARKGEDELKTIFGVVPDFRTGQGIKVNGVHLMT